MLEKGKKWTVDLWDTTHSKTVRLGESSEMNNYTKTSTDYQIIQVDKSRLTIEHVLKTIRVDFDGFGRKMVYDSEDPKNQNAMLGDQIKSMIGKKDTLLVGIDGKVIEEEEKKNRSTERKS
jgi:hypothetical protein